MSQLKHLFKLVLIIIPLFFISACVKKSENVPMDELRSIVAKNENNYTAVLTATELGKTQKVTIKVDGNYNENGEITSCKIFTNLKGQNDYFDINGKTMTAISYVNGQYIGTKSDFKDPPSMSDLNYFRNLLAQNIDIFSYDANKRTYTGTIDHNLDGKVTMRLSVSGGHLVYFDITMISSIVAKMTFEFSNYGTTKIDLPTYTLQNSGSGDQIVYAEGAGQISNTSWKRIINNLPEMYTLKIEGNDPETGELIRNTIHFDNTTGNLSQRDSKYSYLIENNQALYLQSRGSFWFAMVYDGELTNPLEDLKNKYITSYLDFDYNNAIGGYERYLDNLKVEVQFQKSQLSKIVLIKNSNRLEYTVTYDTKSTVYLPTEYELVDELPEMLPTGVTREIWEEICSLNVKSYEAVVHNNSEWNTYVKANKTAFDDSTVYYIEYPHVVHFNEYGSQSETIYYTLIDNQYYKIAKNEYGSYFAEKITKLELPKVDYYEKYITQIRDFDNIKYSWSTYEYIYTTSQYTIYIKASEHNRTLNSIRIVEGDEETTITYRRINSVEPNLPHYQTYYTAPFASKDEWNSATNNIGNNYTLTCTDQMDQVKKTYYFDEINDINYIKIVENEATNYYIKMNNQGYELRLVDNEYVAVKTTLNIDLMLRAGFVTTYLDYDNLIFNKEENYYAGVVVENDISYQIQVHFLNKKLDWVIISSPYLTEKYIFSDYETTTFVLPESNFESVWWNIAVGTTPTGYTLNYTNELNPTQNAIIKLRYPLSANYHNIAEGVYYDNNGDVEYIFGQNTSSGWKTSKIVLIGTSYYLVDYDDFDRTKYELFEPYCNNLVGQFELFTYDPINGTYTGVIDNITYIVKITDGHISHLTVQSSDAIKHFDITDWGNDERIVPKISLSYPDFETKPTSEQYDRMLNDEANSYRFSCNLGNGAAFDKMFLYDGEVIIGSAYRMGIYDENRYNYIIKTATEEYVLYYRNGLYTKKSLDDDPDNVNKLNYLTDKNEIINKFKDHPELVCYIAVNNFYYLTIDNLIYELLIEEDSYRLRVYNDDYSYSVMINQKYGDYSFAIPSTTTKLTEDEFFQMTSNIPLNFEVDIEMTNGSIVKNIHVECQFDVSQYGLIKITDGSIIKYFNGDQMYLVDGDMIVETSFDSELMNIIDTALNYKKIILNYYRTHYLQMRFTPFGDYYYATLPSNLINANSGNMEFKIEDQHISYFKLVYDSNSIIVVCNNYGGVFLQLD